MYLPSKKISEFQGLKYYLVFSPYSSFSQYTVLIRKKYQFVLLRTQLLETELYA